MCIFDSFPPVRSCAWHRISTSVWPININQHIHVVSVYLALEKTDPRINYLLAAGFCPWVSC